MASLATALPECTHRPTCPGCPDFGRPGLAPATRDALAALGEELGGVAVEPVREGDARGHRHRARLMVRGRVGAPKVGLFQQGTHRIADIPRCPVHHPLVNECAAALRAAMRASGVAPYAEQVHRGSVRALQVVVERPTQRAQVVVVTNGESPATVEPMLRALADTLGERLHSLWWNGNPERTNRILGEHWQRLEGEEAVVEEIGGARVFFPPSAFGQSHLPLADRLVRAVHEQVPPGARVVELHAGCGAIGLGLAAAGHPLVCNEIAEGGLRGLALGVEALPPEARERVRVVPGPAADCAAEAATAGVAIVDPPRRGLEPALCEALAERPPERLVYVSCDLGRFSADARRLVAAGRLRLRSLAPFALFPFTDHVETLAVFERS